MTGGARRNAGTGLLLEYGSSGLGLLLFYYYPTEKCHSLDILGALGYTKPQTAQFQFE